MARKEFAKYTEKIRSMLPFWFQMKKQPNESLGLQFLNIFGMQLDDVEKILEFAYEQTRIDSIDETFVDVVYKYNLPVYFNPRAISGVRSSTTFLVKTKSLYEFFGLARNYKLDNAIKQPDYYYVDVERKIVYVREAYDKSPDAPFGSVFIGYEDGEFEAPLRLHHVWNFFDEFGALVGCTRLFGERNSEYKDRILDVFRNPANSTKRGIANGIARELGIRDKVIWKEPDTEDLKISDKMVIANSITVDGELIGEENIYTTTDGYLLLKAMPYMVKKNVEVSYIKGLEVVAFNEKNNNKFSNEMYNADGTPTELLVHYVNLIKRNSSVLWGDFKYNEGMWVKNDDEFINDHFAFIPATFDSNIKGFKKYGFMHKGRTVK